MKQQWCNTANSFNNNKKHIYIVYVCIWWSMHLLKVVIIYLDWQLLQKTDRHCCDLSRLHILTPDPDGNLLFEIIKEGILNIIVIYCTVMIYTHQQPLGPVCFIGWAWQGVKSVSATRCRPISFLPFSYSVFCWTESFAHLSITLLDKFQLVYTHILNAQQKEKMQKK